MEDLKKKAVAAVATVPLDTVATVPLDTVATFQNMEKK